MTEYNKKTDGTGFEWSKRFKELYSIWETREDREEGKIGDKKGKFLKLLEFGNNEEKQNLYSYFVEDVVQYLVGAIAFNDNLSKYDEEDDNVDMLYDSKTEALAMMILEDKLHVWKCEAEYEAKNGGEKMRQRGKKRKRNVDEVEGDRDEVSFLSCKYLLEDTMMNFRPDIITRHRKIATVLQAE